MISETEIAFARDRLSDVMHQLGIPIAFTGRVEKIKCPFHTETDASCVIYPDGHFHCYGCGKSGDAIAFIMQYLSLDFVQAVKYITKGNFISTVSKYTSKYQSKIDEVPEEVIEVYKTLVAHLKPSKYLYHKRGLSISTQQTYGVGTISGREEYIDRLLRDRYSMILLKMSGLYNNNERFRYYFHPVIFPIYKDGVPVFISGRCQDTRSLRFIHVRGIPVTSYFQPVVTSWNSYDTCLIAESPIDAMSIHELMILRGKHERTLCVGAVGINTWKTEFSIHLMNKMKKPGTILWEVWGDRDDSGQSFNTRIVHEIDTCQAFTNYRGKDPNDELLITKGKKTYVSQDNHTE